MGVVMIGRGTLRGVLMLGVLALIPKVRPPPDQFPTSSALKGILRGKGFNTGSQLKGWVTGGETKWGF